MKALTSLLIVMTVLVTGCSRTTGDAAARRNIDCADGITFVTYSGRVACMRPAHATCSTDSECEGV